MSDRPVERPSAHLSDWRTLQWAFGANVTMFVVGLVGWQLAHSAALLGDALDMLADASGYAVAYLAVGGTARQQVRAARWSGATLVLLGIAVMAEVIHRWFGGSEPHGLLISGFALLSLVVNGLVLRMLRKYRDAPQLHLRATWIDTRADVLVNVGVLLSGALVAWTGLRVIDLIAGAVVSIFVIHEGKELWENAEVKDAPRS